MSSTVKVYTQEDLKLLLDKHRKWWEGAEGGESLSLEGANLYGAYLEGANLEGANLEGANLEGANLRGAYLKGANLYGANLYGAYLEGANLEGANLWGAYLKGANLYGANLYGAYLEGANLYGAYLEGANLEGANLRGAYLKGANLEGANLYGANLYGAYLEGANLYGANLEGANLEGANLYGAYLRGATLPPFSVAPTEGGFTAFKKVYGPPALGRNGNDYVLQLFIASDAHRTSSLIGRKCRAKEVVVIAAFNPDGTPVEVKEFHSGHDRSFKYRVGEVAACPDYDDDIRVECTKGIHFFMSRKEAAEYGQ